MASERYVVLGLAGIRAPWFTELARWATSGSVPVEYLKCVSVTEARSRLTTGRPFSILLLDEGTIGVDRDLVDEANRHGCATVVVGGRAGSSIDATLGVSHHLPSNFTRAELLDALVEHGRLVAEADAFPDPAAPADITSPWRGRLVAVTGPAGTGRSTVAMALAQGLADSTREANAVLLADLALDADLGVLHDAGEVVPGLSELVEAHRSGAPGAGEIRSLTFEVVPRRYRLLLGLRRHRDWAALRPRRVEAALESLAGAFQYVVTDVDADLEGEAAVGSVDVEERNVLARSAIRRADLVVVVARPGLGGLHSLVRTASRIMDQVDGRRLLVVVNHAPRSPARRAEYHQAFAQLCPSTGPSPIPLGHRRHLETSTRGGRRFPAPFTRPLHTAVRAALDRLDTPPTTAEEPEPVAAGSLGSWHQDEASNQ
jgi:CO dehydrogenase nickel-insertion accessory protein CooC1